MTEEKNEDMERLQLFIFAAIDKNGHILSLANEKIDDKSFRFYRPQMAQLTFINIKVFSQNYLSLTMHFVIISRVGIMWSVVGSSTW